MTATRCRRACSRIALAVGAPLSERSIQLALVAVASSRSSSFVAQRMTRRARSEPALHSRTRVTLTRPHPSVARRPPPRPTMQIDRADTSRASPAVSRPLPEPLRRASGRTRETRPRHAVSSPSSTERPAHRGITTSDHVDRRVQPLTRRSRGRRRPPPARDSRPVNHANKMTTGHLSEPESERTKSRAEVARPPGACRPLT